MLAVCNITVEELLKLDDRAGYFREPGICVCGHPVGATGVRMALDAWRQVFKTEEAAPGAASPSRTRGVGSSPTLPPGGARGGGSHSASGRQRPALAATGR